MLRRWILYLTAWGACQLFYLFYREWFSWLLLVAVTYLPLVSLLFSLPAMLTAKLTVAFPDGISLGAPLPANVTAISRLPLPRWKAKILCTRSLDGASWVLNPCQPFPADHCGMLECQVGKGKIYDYLGLFCISLRAPQPFGVAIRPIPVMPADPPDSRQYLPHRWKPKPGGGYGESHELRLYRPGDSIQQIHWKLTAKTGKLILREPMEPVDKHPVLWLDLYGTPDVLDEKLGQLLWLSHSLLQQGVPHDILVRCREGVRCWQIRSPREQRTVIDALLGCQPLQEVPVGGCPISTGWQFYIGGTPHEN